MEEASADDIFIGNTKKKVEKNKIKTKEVKKQKYLSYMFKEKNTNKKT